LDAAKPLYINPFTGWDKKLLPPLMLFIIILLMLLLRLPLLPALLLTLPPLLTILLLVQMTLVEFNKLEMLCVAIALRPELLPRLVAECLARVWEEPWASRDFPLGVGCRYCLNKHICEQHMCIYIYIYIYIYIHIYIYIYM
jgi:hypothetical protein